MKLNTATKPAGYAPTALPFYTDLDDSGFEQFCTDLLNLHPTIFCLREGQVTTRRIVSANRLLSGTPQKGADIRAQAEQGEVWFFQCKRTKNFGPADVTEALALAEKSLPQADQFVLVTTRGLSEEAQGRLHERKKWLWWDASNLTTEVLKLRPREEAINLVHRFFGPEWKEALFSSSDQPLLNWREFFSQDLSSDRQHFHHRIPYVPWSGALAHLESFAHSGAGKTLILSAGGGQGKSRLLLELAQNLEKQANAPRVCFLNLNRHGLAPEQSDFFAREEGDLLVIVDDAHRLDSAIQDVARATAAAKSVRLLIATRPQALEAVTSQLFQCGYAERLETPLCLPRWKPEEIHVLAQQILSPQYQLQAARLAAMADRCPLLVVMGGTLINSGAWPETMTSEEAFRERVFRSFKEDLLNRQAENHRARLDRLIKLLSFVSPTPKNEKLLNKAAEILGCSALDVAEDLDRLQAAGMAVENREGIRLYPDLFADAVPLDASLDYSGQGSALSRTILQKLPSSDFPALMRNLAQADWEIRTRLGIQSSLFDPVWTEFTRRFEEGIWVDSYPDFTAWVLEKHTDGNPKSERADRAELLSQWGSFAVYLPEKTLELADLALKAAVLPASNSTNEAQSNARSRVFSTLPPLLKPIVIWHPEFAVRALELLWLFDAEEPKGNWQNSSNSIAAIADAGSFDVHRPIAVAETVLDWFERKTQEPAAVERFRQQPWILSALLKPFFGREVEHNWSTGKVFHCSSLFVSVERTRPLRQKALAIIKRFLDSGDVRLCNAVIPVISEAIHPIHGRFGLRPTKEDCDAWRPDRLEVVKIVESAAGNYNEAAALLLHLRHILWNRCEYDSDEVVRAECQRILAKMPDTFELRVARIMTSFAHDEVHVKPGPDFEPDMKEAERKWTEFRQSVAREAVQRFPTARELCEFARQQVHELATANSSVQGSALLDSVAEISTKWCSSLLEELLGAKDNTLDGFLWSVIHQAATKVPEMYQKAIQSLPLRGRPEQLSSLIRYLGWKHIHGGGLSGSEQQAVLQATKRTEETIGHALASVAGHHFNNDQQLAIEVLKQLIPTGDRAADEILQALARLAEKPNRILTPPDVAQCLANVGARCFPETTSDERSFETIAKWFPRQIYEHIRELYEGAEEDPPKRHPRGFAKTLSFGPFEDQAYVEREIRSLWEKAISADPDTFAQMYPLALIRSLLWSDSAMAADRLMKHVEASNSAEELKLVAELAATRGSRFVFQFPELVRALLVRGENLDVTAAVRETLWLSACGGGRSFTEHEVDPEYRYILEQGDALANRYADDPVLSRFYRMVADSERKNLDWHKRFFAEEELD